MSNGCVNSLAKQTNIMEQEAHFENRIYFFKLLKNDRDEVKITMYNTEYVFRKEDGKWINHANKMNMNAGLIAEVIKVVKKEG